MRRFDLTGRFFEAPRWNRHRWWISDMNGGAVYSLSGDANARLELELDDRPSGLGWMPDGSLIVVCMERRVLLRRPPGSAAASVFADLTPYCAGVAGHLNDMAINSAGDIYVGFDPDFQEYGFQSELGMILHVDRLGTPSVAAGGLQFPNGMVASPDGTTLTVAETGRPRLTQFGIGPAGVLGAPVIWAEMGAGLDRRHDRSRPILTGDSKLDGCALDAQGCIWVADASSPSCLRVGRGGDILDAVFIPANYLCLACALGGEDGRTLLLCGLDLGPNEDLSASVSHLFYCDVETPAA